jgi:hypothetical protein
MAIPNEMRGSARPLPNLQALRRRAAPAERRLRRTAEHAGLGNPGYTFRGSERSPLQLSDLRWVRTIFKGKIERHRSSVGRCYAEEITRKKIPSFGTPT